MRLDLAERLRCPAGHGATPLVVVAQRVAGRDLREGVAGCPLCRLEARVHEGVVYFDAPHDITVAGEEPGRGASGAGDGVARAAVPPAEQLERAAALPAAELERAAALLGLSEPGGTVLLMGSYSALATALHARYEVGIAVVASRGAVPFTDHTFRAAAVGPDVSDDAVRTVAVGGRVLAPAGARLAPGLRELARDEREWVAERERTFPVVATLERAPRR